MTQSTGGIKSEHYPSLELCKKLTEAGFPETKLNGINSLEEFGIYELEDIYNLTNVRCPSVMELFDEIGKVHFPIISEESNGNIRVWVSTNKIKLGTIGAFKESKTLPNALAKMWLWLKENNLLPKR